MTAPSLPATFYPDSSSYSIDEPGGVLRTEVAGGAARYALDWDYGPQRYSVTFLLESDMFSIWNMFYIRVIKKGSIAFWMPLDSGFGVFPHLVNIMPGSYSVTRDGILSIVTCVVEADNMVYDMSDADINAIFEVYGLYGNQGGDVLARIATFANVDTLVLVNI